TSAPVSRRRRRTSRSSRSHSAWCAATNASTSTAGEYCPGWVTLARYRHGARTRLEAAVSEVVTGEAVVLDVPCARFPSRIAAVLIDMAVQLVLLVGVAIVVIVNSGHLDDATTAGIIVSCYVVIVVGYATIFETVSRG